MSAVMSTLSMISGGRRGHPKLSKKSSRKSGQYSDAGEDREPRKDLKEQRSTSLQALETAGAGGDGVAQLETLEAKMASIEVSLSTRTRRVGAGGGAGVASPARARDAPPPAPARELDALRTALRDKESLILSLKEQLCTTLSINRISASLSRAGSPGAGGGGGGAAGAGGGAAPAPGALSQDERRTLEERAAATRRDADDKRAAIAALRQALERLHVTDNIDTRIQQAELEYRLGREELQLLTLTEQSRALQLLIEQADAAHHQTLYSCVRELVGASIVAVEAEWDCKSPRFGAGPRRGAPGLWVDWARDEVPLCKGDRVLEVNGVLTVSCKSAEELWRALAISPRPARLVLLRPAHAAPASPAAAPPAQQTVTMRAEIAALREQAGEARRAEGLRADNLRLTHRISYLEEQVAELLAGRARPESGPEVKIVTGNDKSVMSTDSKRNVTNISITAEPERGRPAPVPAPSRAEVQVFQKGPDITALVANLPGLHAGAKHAADVAAGLPVVRHKAASSRSHSVASEQESERTPRRAHRQSLDSHALHLSRSSHSLDHRCRDHAAERRAYLRQSLSHHCIADDYGAETAAALEIIENNRRLLERPRDRDDHRRHEPVGRSDAGTDDDARVKKTNWAEKKTMSIIEQLKRSQRLRKSRSRTESEEAGAEPEQDYVRRRLDGKVLENTHKSNRRLSKMHARNVKSLDFESESSDFPSGETCGSPRPTDYSSEPGSAKLGYYRKHGQAGAAGAGDAKVRPLPPKKPLRLSLHRAQSSQSVATDVSGEEHRKPSKRSHNGDRFAEACRSPGRQCATPKPSKKLNGLASYGAPAADDLYPAAASCLERGGGPAPAHDARWPPPSSPAASSAAHAEHFRYNGHLSSRGKWC